MVFTDLLRNGFSILIHQKNRINDCGGWFDSENKEFAAAIRGRMGFEILIHEYCHFLQWKERKRFYNKHATDCGTVFSWLDGKFYSKKKVENAIQGIITLEWDCERRAVDLISKHNLDVDIEKYCKAANAYLKFYHVVHQHRKWCDKSPYSPIIMASMPSDLLDLEYYLDSNNLKKHQLDKYKKILK